MTYKMFSKEKLSQIGQKKKQKQKQKQKQKYWYKIFLLNSSYGFEYKKNA